MTYLAMIVKESMHFEYFHRLETCSCSSGLRVYRPVPLTNRTATKETILPRGYGPDGTAPVLVRKGEVVVFSHCVNARRRNLFGPDAMTSALSGGKSKRIRTLMAGLDFRSMMVRARVWVKILRSWRFHTLS